MDNCIDELFILADEIQTTKAAKRTSLIRVKNVLQTVLQTYNLPEQQLSAVVNLERRLRVLTGDYEGETGEKKIN